MQIFRTIWWYGVLGVITSVAVFGMVYIRSHAEEIATEEVWLVHTHTEVCYGDVTVNCEHCHTFRYGQERYENFRCSNCGRVTSHRETYDQGFCSSLNSTWVYNGVTSCTVCGTVYASGWDGYPAAAHTRTIRGIVCGIQEGEPCVGVQITADNQPVNNGVMLHLKYQGLQDAIAGISGNWEQDSLWVTENGIYDVTVTDNGGNCVSVSIEVSWIDKNVPVIEGVTHDEASVTQNSVKVQIAASDEGSGLAEKPFSVDGGMTWQEQNTVVLYEGVELTFAVKDKAGNITYKTLKRQDFPYPPTPVITPAPEPEQTPAPVITPIPEAAQTPAAVQAAAGASVAGKKKYDTEKEEKKLQKSGKKEIIKEGVLTVSEETQKEKNGIAEEGMAVTETVSAGDAGMLHFPTAAENPADSDRQPTDGEEKTEEKTGKSGSTETTEKKKGNGLSAENGSRNMLQMLLKGMMLLLAGFCTAFLLVWAGRCLWRYSVILYCYDGGDTYRKLGVFFLHRREADMALYLPETLTETTDIFRYRLHLKRGLVKHCAGRELVVYSEDGELHRPLEECVDFVL